MNSSLALTTGNERPQESTPPAFIVRPRLSLALSPRDRHILSLAARKLGASVSDFDEALRALREAVCESIPAGRVFYLGSVLSGPVIGSTISGVGIAPAEDGVVVVRVLREGVVIGLGAFTP